MWETVSLFFGRFCQHIYNFHLSVSELDDGLDPVYGWEIQEILPLPVDALSRSPNDTAFKLLLHPERCIDVDATNNTVLGGKVIVVHLHLRHFLFRFPQRGCVRFLVVMSLGRQKVGNADESPHRRSILGVYISNRSLTDWRI
jgi:hypothetical protein